MDLATLIRTACGEVAADLVLTNGRLVNVLTGEIHTADVAVVGTRIAGLGTGYDAAEVVDLEGRYLCPGLIDAHVHVESSLCTPHEFARAVLPHGVTTIVSDPHEIANVLGLEGIQFMLQEAKYGPLSMYVMAPSCVPATDMETAGAELYAEDLQGLRSNPWIIGLAEVMNYPGVVTGDPVVLEKIELFADRVLDGHAPSLVGRALNAYVAAGIRSDHECTTVAEMHEKLRLGMMIYIREATGAHNLHALLPGVTADNARRICFCTDDRHPADLIDDGSIDHLVRESIAAGLPPMRAIRMATLNPAEHFGLRDAGAIAPGRRADMLVVSDLEDFVVEDVYRGGRLVARDGVALPVERPGRARRMRLRSSVNIDWDDIDFAIPARGRRARVIGHTPGSLVTEHRLLEPKVVDGQAVADPARDLLKMVVIERHRATGRVGKGFVQGLGLRRGALASTVAHDHHNLVVTGADDRSMKTAARRAARLGGGLVAAEGDQVLAELALPVAGLMSPAPVEEVRAACDQLAEAARGLGSEHPDPLMALSFLALEVIPALKLTDVGLVDVERFEVVDLWVD